MELLKTKSDIGNAQEFLNQIQIASPCPALWENMNGDDRVRNCAQCQKKVYNLSTLKADEAVALIKEKEGNLCMKFYRRYDGTVMTSDCPVGIKERAQWLWWRVTAAAASFAAWIFLVGCGSKPTHQNAASTANPTVGNKHTPYLRPLLGGVAFHPQGRPLMGKVACPPTKNDSEKGNK